MELDCNEIYRIYCTTFCVPATDLPIKFAYLIEVLYKGFFYSRIKDKQDIKTPNVLRIPNMTRNPTCSDHISANT